jgi:pilus assembly protein CpaF
MRPDRIIVGECRGGEAMDMLQAMNTGHEGSITTCHANSPRDALKRIETMAMMSGLEIPHSVIREQVASAIHIIVQLMRRPNGNRVVESIVEVDRLETDQILTQEIFKFNHGKGNEKLMATGLKPSFEVPLPSHEFGQRNQL